MALYSDVNGDRIQDVTLTFAVQDMQIAPTTDRLELSGKTLEGDRFAGEDRVRVVPAARTGAQAATKADAALAPDDLSVLGVQGSSGSVRVRLALPSSDAASVELFDLAGRRRASAEIVPLGAGTHVVELRGEPSLAKGVYWLRLRQGQQIRTTKAVLLE